MAAAGREGQNARLATSIAKPKLSIPRQSPIPKCRKTAIRSIQGRDRRGQISAG